MPMNRIKQWCKNIAYKAWLLRKKCVRKMAYLHNRFIPKIKAALLKERKLFRKYVFKFWKRNGDKTLSQIRWTIASVRHRTERSRIQLVFDTQNPLFSILEIGMLTSDTIYIKSIWFCTGLFIVLENKLPDTPLANIILLMFVAMLLTIGGMSLGAIIAWLVM